MDSVTARNSFEQFGRSGMFMPGANLRPLYGLLIFGISSLFLAIGGTCTGEAWARFGRVVYRPKNRRSFGD